MHIRRGYADTSSGQLHFRECGSASLPTLVLLHQTASSGAQFEGLMPQLVDVAHCLAFDLPGFGNSFAPERQQPMSWYTDCVMEAVAALGHTRVGLFGHHTGAGIGVDWASRADARVEIATLMLSGPPLLSDEDLARFAARVHALEVLPDGSHLLEVWNTLKQRNPDMPLALLQREALLTLQAVRYHESYVAAFGQPMAEQLKRIRCKTWVIGGTRDSLRNSVAPAAALVPGSTVTWIDSDTYLTDSHPAELARLLRRILSSDG